MKNCETFKNCTNCKYYLKHYSIRRSKLYTIGGHCIHDKLFRKIKEDTIRYNCTYWQQQDDKKEELHEDIQKTICKMKKKLTEIALILNNEDNI